MEDQDNEGAGPTHWPGTRKGEDIKDEEGSEPGRTDTSATGADRPAGETTVRDSTAINPDDAESVTETPTIPPA